MNQQTMPSSIVDAQVQRLLELVAEYKQQQCDSILDHARRQSGKIIRDAYRSARDRIHNDIQLTRQDMREKLSAARAKQHTVKMQQQHNADMAFLNQAWQRLADKLKQRWQNPRQREQWIQTVLSSAAKVLPDQHWQVECPGDWPDVERDRLSELANRQFGRTISFYGAADIETGIRIGAGGAWIDGTLQGLTADRMRIESEMLAQLRPRKPQSEAGDSNNGNAPLDNSNDSNTKQQS
ncbi:MAG: hypothetical protein PVJ39_12325 [Gammaproteobacteria bacterium]|jgi:hypothetical protein